MDNLNQYGATHTGPTPMLPHGTAGPMWFIQPLFATTMQMKVVGWCLIALGIMYCLTIVGILIGWVPIWMGICFKSAGEQFDFASQTQNANAAQEGSRQLGTALQIMFYTLLLFIILIALYFLTLFALILLGIFASISASR